MDNWDQNERSYGDEQQGGGGEEGGLFPEGNYRARASGAGLGETKKGDPQLAITLVLLDHAGKVLNYYGSFSDKSFEFTMKALRACGWKGVDLSDGFPGIDANEVSIAVKHDTYEGKTTAKVAWVNPPGGVALKKQLDPNAAKAFAARMRGQIAGFDATNGGGGQRSPAPQGNGQRPQQNGAQRPPQQQRADGFQERNGPPPQSREAPQQGRGGPPQQQYMDKDGYDQRRDPNDPNAW